MPAVTGHCHAHYDIGHIPVVNGWQGETAEALEAAWADCTWELEVDGRAVDLAAFGIPFWDADEPSLRVWNVALRSPTPGEHSVRRAYDIADQRADDTWVFTVDDKPAIDNKPVTVDC